MTITLYLQKETLLRDLQTLQRIFQYNNVEGLIEKLRKYYEPLNISISKEDLILSGQVAIQVTPEEFALIGIFNGGI